MRVDKIREQLVLVLPGAADSALRARLEGLDTEKAKWTPSAKRWTPGWRRLRLSDRRRRSSEWRGALSSALERSGAARTGIVHDR